MTLQKLPGPRDVILLVVLPLVVGAFGAYVGIRVGLAEVSVKMEFLLSRIEATESRTLEHYTLPGHPVAMEKHKQVERRLELLENQP